MFIKMLKFSFQLLQVLLVTSSSLASSFSFDVEKKVYPNGLTVLVHSKNDVPVLSVHSWFKVGAKDEEPGKTGLAHFFEHLMFSGTEKYPQKQFESLMESKGIQYNAYTNQDSTVYYQQLPASELDFVLDYESDRLKNLKITNAKFESEKKVILEERLKRVEDSTEGLMMTTLFDKLFKTHPYKNPVIGLKNDLKNLTLNDANAFFSKHYKTSNLILSIAGAVNSDEAFKLVEKYYANIPGEVLQGEHKKVIQEPELEAPVKAIIAKDIEVEKVIIAYKIGKLGERESYAFDLLSHILSGDKTSRLYKKLVLQNSTVAQVAAYSYNLDDAGVFEIDLVLKEKAQKEGVLATIDEELKRLINIPVTKEELARAQLYTVKETLKSLRSSQSRSRLLGLNEALLGDYKRLFSDVDLYQTITAQEIQTAAKNRFLNKNSVVVELVKK